GSLDRTVGNHPALVRSRKSRTEVEGNRTGRREADVFGNPLRWPLGRNFGETACVSHFDQGGPCRSLPGVSSAHPGSPSGLERRQRSRHCRWADFPRAIETSKPWCHFFSRWSPEHPLVGKELDLGGSRSFKARNSRTVTFLPFRFTSTKCLPWYGPITS